MPALAGVPIPTMLSEKWLALLLTFVAASARAEPAPPAAPLDRADVPPPTSAPARSSAASTSATPTAPEGAATPVNSTPVPASPPPAPAPPASPPIAATPSPPIPSAAGTARVRFAVNYDDAWLEARPFGVEESWRRVCKAPCGEWIAVEGAELRVTADSMTPSGPFRVDAGSGGAALLTVKGGSSVTRSLGRLGLVVGVPVSLLGMTGFAYGHFDERRGLETAGAVTLGVGAALVLTALPLLVMGSTSVRNDKGDLIATGSQPAAL